MVHSVEVVIVVWIFKRKFMIDFVFQSRYLSDILDVVEVRLIIICYLQKVQNDTLACSIFLSLHTHMSVSYAQYAAMLQFKNQKYTMFICSYTHVMYMLLQLHSSSYTVNTNNNKQEKFLIVNFLKLFLFNNTFQ